MIKPKLQIQEKYLGDSQLREILVLMFLSDISTNVKESLFVFDLQQKGIDYGM